MVDTNAETSDGEWHEIIPVPTPHGRLGDLDKLKQLFSSIDRALYSAADIVELIDSASTIVEAEPEVHDCDNCKWFGGLMCDHVDENYKCLGWEAWEAEESK